MSIQAHPDKSLAAELFKKYPKIYKDSNHKPEMAIALTEFEALVGFRPISEIQNHLNLYPEFKSVLDHAAVLEFDNLDSNSSLELNKKGLKGLFKSLMEADCVIVSKALEEMNSRLHSLKDKSCLDSLLIKTFNQYPGDVGVFCLMFLNYVVLTSGQAIFLAANEPHAYLSG